jgi:hypothetical protein
MPRARTVPNVVGPLSMASSRVVKPLEAAPAAGIPCYSRLQLILRRRSVRLGSGQPINRRRPREEVSVGSARIRR